MYYEENEVIEFIRDRIKDDYQLEKNFNKEFIEHCENVGSLTTFFFKWEDTEFEIKIRYLEEEEEMIYIFQIREY